MQRQLAPLGQGVVRRQHRHQVLAEQQPALHGLQGQLAGDADQGEVQLPLTHRRQQRLALVLAQLDVHLRMTAVEGRQHIDDVQPRHRGNQAHRQGAADGADRGRHVLLQPRHRRQRLARMDQHCLAGGGDAHLTRQPLEQAGAQLGLQPGDLMAERRLHHMATFGGAGEMALFGQGDGEFQLLEIHGVILKGDESHLNDSFNR